MSYQNSERWQDLINKLLDIEKMESGAMSYKPEVFNVVGVLQRGPD
jgi:K+-sensing histidine kinase KdpD